MTVPSGLIIVDKPGGMTSHDVVARIRKLAGTRRVGHAGTLDPMATGVLVVGVEKATRLLGYLTLTEKEYTATIRLGQSTSTDDAEGEPTGGAAASGISRAALDAGVARLTGEIYQVPPGVSAIKVGGQRAYKLTRAGAAPDLAARRVTVYEFAIGEVRPCGDYLDVDARIRCSSGTYIRALARDLGAALGTGGHLTALRRTAVGPYRLQQAHSLEDLSERMQLTPLPAAAAAAFPRLDLTADDARRLAHGVRIPVPPHGIASQETPPPAPGVAPATPGTPGIAPATPGTASAAPGAAPATPQTPIAAFAPDGTLVALVAEESGRLRCLAVFADPPRAAALGPGGDG
jgi:tRNA pseudouridine55 synthase